MARCATVHMTDQTTRRIIEASQGSYTEEDVAMRIKSLWSVTIRAALDWWGDNCLRLAASLAYYTALSLAPLLLLIVGLTGMVLGREQVATQLAAQLEGLMGPAGRELVTSILTTTSPTGGHVGDRRRPRHPGHWRDSGLRRAPGDDEPHLGGPARPHRRGLGRDSGPGSRRGSSRSPSSSRSRSCSSSRWSSAPPSPGPPRSSGARSRRS